MVINFAIVALALFFVVKGINRLRREEAESPTPKSPPRQEVLLEEIRDLLKAR